MPASSYLVGRQPGALPQVIKAGSTIEDSLFASQRLDNRGIEGVTFKHCTFANVSFKNCKMKNLTFIDCVFVDCYFRGTRLEDSAFNASKFIDCDFTKIDLRRNDFRYYNHFKGCWIPRRELQHGLPQEPNLKHHLCVNLSDEARLAGDVKDAEWYRQAGVAAQEEYLKAAFTQSSQYYKEKFRGWDRVAAFVEYASSRLRGYLWGYKRSYLVVLRNWAFTTLILFPALFFAGRRGLQKPDGPAEWTDAWLASIGSMLPGSSISQLKYTSGYAQTIAFLEVLTGVLFGGLTVTLLFRAVFERWK
ncbi:pentapeptide repeat-containing protein [Micromonospora sp. WMMD967]|uniref:pentapeptide repeat-containing protein n=1 Tax=Micromonospora sp. WMMD967 TaxID=3016101 RepID=UPI0024169CE7|nr:pentapeptide repeat-containing protein [Micromonospora sp. WMMD967]MDG4835316.1 pentapeptide repeat-containing protein [Micromonospora sp. WMMD967]